MTLYTWFPHILLAPSNGPSPLPLTNKENCYGKILYGLDFIHLRISWRHINCHEVFSISICSMHIILYMIKLILIAISQISLLFSCYVVSNSCNPMDCSPPGSSVHGISQARILEWVSNIISQFSWVQSLSRVRLFVTPWTAACQASLSITNSWSLLKLMSIKSVMPSSHHVIPFSSCPQSLPAPGSFPKSQLFTWGGQSIGVSASESVLPMNTQDWSPSAWTGWISLQSKGLSRVFSNTTVQKHQFFCAQLSSPSNSHINTRPLEKPSNVMNEMKSAQSCPTLCDPTDCSLLGSSLHGILQARILEWIAISFSRGSSQLRDRTQVSCTAGTHFNLWATREILPFKIWVRRLKMKA